MENRKGKIGINSAFIIYLTAIFSPTVRIFGNYTSIEAKQAAWLSPIIASIVIGYLILKLNTLLVENPGLSLIKIYEKIVGKFLTKIIAFIYLIRVINLIGGNTRAYTSRLSTVIYPNINGNLFLVVTLIIIGTLIIQSGFVVASRMFKFFFWVVFFGFCLLTSLLLPNVEIDKLTPISYLDMIPIMKASVSIIYTWSYVTIIFIMSDNMIGVKDFKKRGLQTLAFLFISVTTLLISMVGTSGSSLLAQSAFPYLITVEQIELLNSIAGIEAILMVLWILTDFTMISLLTFTSLKLIKYIFNIEDANLYTYPLLILIFFVSNTNSENFYQFREYAKGFIYPTNIILFVGIPILMAWIYKLRKKASRALRTSK